MPLTRRTLFKQSGGDPQLHIYRTNDAIAEVVGANYFNGATDDLKRGDVILAVTSFGSTPALRLLVVTSATAAATVTVAAAVQV